MNTETTFEESMKGCFLGNRCVTLWSVRSNRIFRRCGRFAFFQLAFVARQLHPDTGATFILRLEAGNFSSVKGAGAGIYELRMHFGPGYRVYFGKDGDRLVILLGGGTKKRQQKDIEAAQALWKEYKLGKGQ